jgi:DNA polymerase-3 subunit gamma/tau
MRDALSTLDQALSFSEGRLTVDEALLVTGAIGKAALADYVTAIADGDVETALRKIEEIFASGKNMGRFVDDLLAYYRELLLDPEASLPHGLIFKWIDLAVETTKLLRETTQEKTAVEVMAMRMAEIKAPTASMSSGNAPSAAATSEIPADVMGIIQGLQDQVAALQAQLMRLQTTGVKAAAGSGAAPGQAAPAPTEEGPYFNRNMVNAALDLSFKDNRKPELETAWPEIINHFTMPRERALLKTSKPVAASTDYVVVTFDTDVLAKQIAKDEGLRIQFGNYMSMIAGFAPELLALSESDWQEVRSDYIQAMGKNKQTEEKPKEKAPDPVVTEAQALFGDLVSVEDN